MVSRACPVALALLAVACAHTPDQTEPAPNWGIASASTVDTFEIGGTGRNWGVKVTDTEILGIQPDFALARTDGEIRGRALGVPVVVGFHADQGAGVYRGAPFEVYATHTPAGLHVTGIFGGAISNYELSTERINGRVGICGYDLRWNGKVYSGFRGCGQRDRGDLRLTPGHHGQVVGHRGGRGAGDADERGRPDPGRPAGRQLSRVPRWPRAGRGARALLPDVLRRARWRLLRRRRPAHGRRGQRGGRSRRGWTAFRANELDAQGVRVGPGVY